MHAIPIIVNIKALTLIKSDYLSLLTLKLKEEGLSLKRFGTLKKSYLYSMPTLPLITHLPQTAPTSQFLNYISQAIFKPLYST